MNHAPSPSITCMLLKPYLMNTFTQLIPPYPLITRVTIPKWIILLMTPLMDDVLQVGDVISHGNVIFGVDFNSSMNCVVSIIVYYIYKEWLICSFENKIRRPDISHRSLIIYLKIRMNVCSKCFDPSWYGVCNKLEMLVLCVETDIAM